MGRRRCFAASASSSTPAVASEEHRPLDRPVYFTSPGSVKQRTLEALGHGVRVVIGTSGLTAADYLDIEGKAKENRLGVIAAGNFSITAALAKRGEGIRHAARLLQGGLDEVWSLCRCRVGYALLKIIRGTRNRISWHRISRV
jgi:dihydrodipicolinate reductase